MCGSGTFLTEAALDRGRCGAGARARVLRLHAVGAGTTPRCGRRLRSEARARRAARAPRRCIFGSDIDADAVRMAIANGERAGVAEWLHLEKRALGDVQVPRAEFGLVVTNPPYGERIGAESGLPELYAELGRTLRDRFKGWQAAILTGNPPLARNLGIYAKRTHRVFNGTIECRLLRFDLNEAREQRPAGGGARGLVEPSRRTDVRQSAAQEPRAAGIVGRARTHRLLPSVRRRHAGVRVRHRRLRPRAAPCPCARICSAEIRESRGRAGAAPGSVVGRARGSIGAACLRALPSAQTAKGGRAIRKARTHRRAARGAGRGTQVLGQLPRLFGYGTVSRPPHHPADAARLGQGHGFPEFVLLHRKRHGVRRGRRRALERERRSCPTPISIGRTTTWC